MEFEAKLATASPFIRKEKNFFDSKSSIVSDYPAIAKTASQRDGSDNRSKSPSTALQKY